MWCAFACPVLKFFNLITYIIIHILFRNTLVLSALPGSVGLRWPSPKHFPGPWRTVPTQHYHILWYAITWPLNNSYDASLWFPAWSQESLAKWEKTHAGQKAFSHCYACELHFKINGWLRLGTFWDHLAVVHSQKEAANIHAVHACMKDWERVRRMSEWERTGAT